MEDTFDEQKYDELRKAYDDVISHMTIQDWENANGCPSTEWDFVKWKSYDHMERDLAESDIVGYSDGQLSNSPPPSIAGVAKEVQAMRQVLATRNKELELAGYTRTSNGAWFRPADPPGSSGGETAIADNCRVV
jgi:hypothetical protein